MEAITPADVDPYQLHSASNDAFPFTMVLSTFKILFSFTDILAKPVLVLGTATPKAAVGNDPLFTPSIKLFLTEAPGVLPDN